MLVPLVLLTFAMHTPRGLPVADPIVVSRKPLELFSISDQRDTLVVREARRQGVPRWLALSISHAENWSGDSVAVNPYSGAIGLLQIHPVNFQLREIPRVWREHNKPLYERMLWATDSKELLGPQP